MSKNKNLKLKIENSPVVEKQRSAPGGERQKPKVSGAGVGGILQKGTSLYLAVMLMTILLAIALGISSIFLGQTKVMREMGNSVIAFYAADAGIEKVLMQRVSPSDIPETTLSNGATYRVFVTAGGTGSCTSPNYCIKSVGEYRETRRAIEVNY